MNLSRTIVVLAIAASLLTGCGSFKKLTGQRNDTILPGQREDIFTSRPTGKIQDPARRPMLRPCDPDGRCELRF